MNYSQDLPHYQRQFYQVPADQSTILSNRNEYSTGQKSWQGYGESNTPLDNNQSPIKLSYSNLSQDSAYHSRHNSAVDMGGDPGTGGLYPFPGTKTHVHGRFPSWPEPDKLQSEGVTHMDEVLSPRTSKRVFQEASARNAHSVRLKNRPSQNYPNFQQNSGNLDDVNSLRFDAVLAQPQRTKSFTSRAELTGLSSMIPGASLHYRSSNDISQPPVGARYGSGGPVGTCRPFYNTSTQTDPSWRETDGGGIRSPRFSQGRTDAEGGSQDPRAFQFPPESEGGLDREWTTAKPPHAKDSGFAADDRFLATVMEASSPEMGYGSDDRLNRNIGSARQPDSGEIVGQQKGYLPNQSSMIRQLSKELYGQAGKRGVGLTSRMIISGERQSRLGSINEDTQINEGQGYESREDLRTRRKSCEGDRNSTGALYGLDGGNAVWRGSSLGGGVNKLSDQRENSGYVVEEGLGNGTGFVRNRKSQLSLRKAFGIFDEFEIMESGPRNVPRQASKSVKTVGDSENQKDFDAVRGSKSSLASSDVLRNQGESNDRLWQRSPDDRVLPRSPDDRVLHHSPEAHIVVPQSPRKPFSPQDHREDVAFRSSTGDLAFSHDHDLQKPFYDASFEAGWQRDPIDMGGAQGPPIASSAFPASDISRAIARKKSESLPRQQTPLLMSENAGRRLSSHDPGAGVLYTGTGVLSVNLLSRPENLQQLTEVQGATDGRELDRTKPPTSPSSSSAIYRNSPRSPARAMSPLAMFDNTSPSSGPRDARSPAPPELPPRQYLKPNITGDDKGVELFSSNDSDVDSTLKRDTYAQQLRQEARRLSHSHSTSHPVRRQPTLPYSSSKALASSEEINDFQTEGQYEVETGVVPLMHSYSVSSQLPLEGNVGDGFEMDRTMESSSVEPASSGQTAESSYGRVKSLSAKFSRGSASEKSYAPGPNNDRPTEIVTRLSSTVLPTGPSFRSSRPSNQFQEESEERGNFIVDQRLKSSVEVSPTFHPTATPFSISAETSDFDIRNRSGSLSQTVGSTHSSSDGAEVETKPKHRSKVGLNKGGKSKEKIDTAIVLPNVRSIESTPEKDSAPTLVSGKGEKTARASPGKVAKIKCLPRQWKSTEESAYECPAPVDVHQLPVDERNLPGETSTTHSHPEASSHSHPMSSSAVRRSRHKQKHLSKASTYDDPASIIPERLPDDERKPDSTPVTTQQLPKAKRRNPSKAASVVTQDLPDDEKNLPSAPSKPSIIQHLPESTENPSEASSNSHRPPAPTTFLRHPNDEKRSSGKFSSPLHKTAADYMSGLFTEEDDNSAVQSDTLTRNSVQRASLRSRLLVARQAKENKEKVSGSILSEEGPCLSDDLPEIPLDVKSSGDEIQATSSEEEKLELIRVLEKKLEILRDERQLLNEEISENKILGRQVSAIVEQRLEAKELSKYRSYVDELEKVLYLVLKLSDRLAKAENAILALPQNASDKEKAVLVSKRNDLSEKHVDALSLKEGIDRRRYQVAGYLEKCLSEAELKDYEYFVKMKAQLVIDQQEVEDKIEMGQRQLDLLRSTMNSDFESATSGGYFGPKSYC